MIFKLQRPLVPYGGAWLVYDEHRSFMSQMEPTQEMIDAIGDRLKVYVKARLEFDNTLSIEGPAPDQTW